MFGDGLLYLYANGTVLLQACCHLSSVRVQFAVFSCTALAHDTLSCLSKQGAKIGTMGIGLIITVVHNDELALMDDKRPTATALDHRLAMARIAAAVTTLPDVH
jgi:hypothetical protein